MLSVLLGILFIVLLGPPLLRLVLHFFAYLLGALSILVGILIIIGEVLHEKILKLIRSKP